MNSDPSPTAVPRFVGVGYGRTRGGRELGTLAFRAELYVLNFVNFGLPSDVARQRIRLHKRDGAGSYRLSLIEGGFLNSLRGVRALTSLQGDPRRLWVVAGVAGLMLLFAVHLALISRANTITWDEPDHIYSGYMSWHGDFGLNPEHPPLVKFVATVPLLAMQLNVPELQDRPYRLQAVLGGRDFIFHNDADKMVFRAQMAASIFTLLLLAIAFLAAQEMFGTSAGFLALGLLVFDPTLLAHGALVTTDAAQACFLLASIYAFYRYVQLPSAGRVAMTALAAGLALASKHSAVLVFPMLLILAGIEIFRRQSADSGSQTFYG